MNDETIELKCGIRGPKYMQDTMSHGDLLIRASVAYDSQSRTFELHELQISKRYTASRKLSALDIRSIELRPVMKHFRDRFMEVAEIPAITGRNNRVLMLLEIGMLFQGDPGKLIAAEFGVSTRTASRWIKEVSGDGDE